MTIESPVRSRTWKTRMLKYDESVSTWKYLGIIR
jgi:hypothetical protein